MIATILESAVKMLLVTEVVSCMNFEDKLLINSVWLFNKFSSLDIVSK